MADNSIPIGDAVPRMTYTELELETAVETTTKCRADAQRRRAELRSPNAWCRVALLVPLVTCPTRRPAPARQRWRRARAHGSG